MGYRNLVHMDLPKAALQNLVECLYFDLNKYGIKLQIINPGFVKTDATSINDFKMPQLISAEKAAFFIFNGLHSSKFERFSSIIFKNHEVIKTITTFILFKISR